MAKIFLLVIAFSSWLCRGQVSNDTCLTRPKESFTIQNCVNSFDSAKIDKTNAGYQYWFVDRNFLDGRTVKLSAVAAGLATHPPHKHSEDEFFFILEGTAEFFLAGEKKIVYPYTCLYCPPMIEHGIKNAGENELKYLVIKKYNK